MSNEIAFHVFTTHTAGPDDATPLQIISQARLADLERIEAAALALVGAVAATPEPAPAKDKWERKTCGAAD